MFGLVFTILLRRPSILAALEKLQHVCSDKMQEAQAEATSDSTAHTSSASNRNAQDSGGKILGG